MPGPDRARSADTWPKRAASTAMIAASRALPAARLTCPPSPASGCQPPAQGISPDTLELLQRRGHQLQLAPAMGSANSVEVLPAGGSLGEAAEAAFAVEPRFDATVTFGRLLSLEAFAAVQQMP